MRSGAVGQIDRMNAVVDRRDRAWVWLAAIVVVGLALRIAGAQGGLWLDEAWSAKLAHDAGTPIGIFLNINHDNNHHINSLWLQTIGFGASPLLARALSIVAGTLAIVVAASIAASRGRAAMLVTAWLFALSPILVTLGSEARGYAPMTLALLCAIRIVDRHLTGDPAPSSRALALCFFLGTLSQLTIVFGICAILGWASIASWRRHGVRHAVTAVWRLFAAPLLALAAALALVFVPALMSPTGFQFGRYDPFAPLPYLHGIGDLVAYTLALAPGEVWPIAVAPLLIVSAAIVRLPRLALYLFAILAFPIALALLHAGNVAHARYYLVAGVVLLLLTGDLVAFGWTAEGWRRRLGAIGLLGFSVAASAADVDLIRNRRGDPAAAIDTMRARAPAGSTVTLDRETSLAPIEQAAARARYPLTIDQADCKNARFMFVERFVGESFPARVLRCGVAYLPIDGRYARGMSGTHWTLYERRP